jgi:S1-C subfamily serine protease
MYGERANEQKSREQGFPSPTPGFLVLNMIVLSFLLLTMFASVHPFIGPPMRRVQRPKQHQSAWLSNTISRWRSDPPQPFGSDFSIPREDGLLDSVVRIYCTHTVPNFAMPWQRQQQESSTSSGFAISNGKDGFYILTNAHAIEYGSLVQVKRREAEDKFTAKVVAVGHECDLAILMVDDSAFWEGLEPLSFGTLPALLDSVSVVGYPVGGEQISITTGVVSRVEMQEYAQASAQLLAIQIDAAINPGNSGGPVFDSDSKVIGVAFQSLAEEDTENIGYVVPVTVIDHFLKDVERCGYYSGVCSLGVQLQGLENKDMQSYYQMSVGADGLRETGVLVLSVAPTAPAMSVLRKGDIILSVDGIRIANDGTIPFREGSFKERVSLGYFFSQKFAGDNVTLQVLRKGATSTDTERLSVTTQVWVREKTVPRELLESSRFVLQDGGSGSKGPVDNGAGGNGHGGSRVIGGAPSYAIIGGLVFVRATMEYLESVYEPQHMTDFEPWAGDYLLLSQSAKNQETENEEVGKHSDSIEIPFPQHDSHALSHHRFLTVLTRISPFFPMP